MKKFLAILLAAMLLLSMGAVAVAEDISAGGISGTAPSSPYFTKQLKIENSGTTVDDTVFSFTATFVSYKPDNLATTAVDSSVKGPDLTLSPVTLNSTTTSGNVTITHNTGNFPKVGVYTYTVTEAAATVAGIVNSTATLKLVVTVTNNSAGTGFDEKYAFYVGDTKNQAVVNTYKAGELKISKTVTGTMGDKTEYFEFKVTLTGETGKTYAETFSVTGGSYTDNPKTISIGSETTFHLKHDETLTIANIPYGVTYSVTETEVTGYTTTKTNDSGTIGASSVTAAFTNDKEGGTIETGITTDSLPYMMLLGFVLLAGAALIIKRRMAH